MSERDCPDCDEFCPCPTCMTKREDAVLAALKAQVADQAREMEAKGSAMVELSKLAASTVENYNALEQRLEAMTRARDAWKERQTSVAVDDHAADCGFWFKDDEDDCNCPAALDAECEP